MAVIRLREKRDARRVAVKKIFAAHRTDLALCKKPCNRDRSYAFLDHVSVMMGSAEEALAPAAAAEQERP